MRKVLSLQQLEGHRCDKTGQRAQANSAAATHMDCLRDHGLRNHGQHGPGSHAFDEPTAQFPMRYDAALTAESQRRFAEFLTGLRAPAAA